MQKLDKVGLKRKNSELKCNIKAKKDESMCKLVKKKRHEAQN